MTSFDKLALASRAGEAGGAAFPPRNGLDIAAYDDAVRREYLAVRRDLARRRAVASTEDQP